MRQERLHPFFSEAAILFPVLLLAGMGIIMVYSASSALAMERFANPRYYMQKQLLFFFVSFIFMFITASFPYRIFKVFAYIILLSAIAMLCAVHIPSLGHRAGGACRWLRIGKLTFQPSEFVKPALIIFLAYSLSKKQEMIKDFSVGFVPHGIILAILAILVMAQPDFGTVMILGIITWAMMFIAGVRIRYLISPIPFLIPLAYFFVYKVHYRMNRIFAFLHPWDDPMNTGYQITHSLKAFGSGGILGKGLGLGIQKLHYLPEPHTDFILSVIGEELGLIGVVFTLFLYSVIIWKGAQIARNAEDTFGSLLAAGITISLGIQVIINTGVALGVLPTKGLTLPFLSYGGTSLFTNMSCMGILMNIGASSNANR